MPLILVPGMNRSKPGQWANKGMVNNMQDKYEVIMAGSGGQGLIVCGIILAEAAMLEGKNVAQTQAYGIASRGGFSKSEVVISSSEIIYQQVQNPDLILALTDQAMDMYAQNYTEIPIFYDTSLLERREGANLHGYSFTEMASELGHVGTANIIALGAMAALTSIVKVESLAEVLKQRFTGKVAEMNVKALHKGVDLVRK